MNPAAAAIIFGITMGFSLGLTGGGGSILAVPMLVYGLGMDPKAAMGTSLAAVGATALLGALPRMRRGEVETSIGLMFGMAGILGAPLGSWIKQQLRSDVLLYLFAALMLWIAIRMWLKATRRPADAAAVRAFSGPIESGGGPVCKFDPQGKLRMTSPCAARMACVGVITGIMSGLFGVGGGFIIVPALVLLSGMNIHRAVATSLLVIPMVSASGLASHLLQHQPIDTTVTLLFVLGGMIGMELGTLIARRTSPVKLQKVFAVVIVGLAIYMTIKTLWPTRVRTPATKQAQSTDGGPSHVLSTALHSGTGDRLLHGG